MEESMAYRKFLMATAAVFAGLAGTVLAADTATVAFLMPDQASTRYEQHDFPGFKAEMKSCARAAR
jgi:D-xylose transport system substrate-binding protein